MMLRAQAKGKKDIFGFMKNLKFFLLKEIINSVKVTHRMGENICKLFCKYI